MKRPTDNRDNDEIARVAQAIWEAEGRPEGRDVEHWLRAKQLIAEGRAEAEYPELALGAGEEGAFPAPPDLGKIDQERGN